MGNRSLLQGSSQLRDRTQVSCIAGGFFAGGFPLSHQGNPIINLKLEIAIISKSMQFTLSMQFILSCLTCESDVIKRKTIVSEESTNDIVKKD